MKQTTQQKTAENIYSDPRGPALDTEQIRRLSHNLAVLLSGFLKVIGEFESESKPMRTRIVADLKDILGPIPPAQRGSVWSTVVCELEKHLQDPAVVSTMGKALAARALSKHTVKVEGVGNCLGSSGLGVNVTVNGAMAGACVTGTLSSGPTGGGVSGGFRY